MLHQQWYDNSTKDSNTLKLFKTETSQNKKSPIHGAFKGRRGGQASPFLLIFRGCKEHPGKSGR